MPHDLRLNIFWAIHLALLGLFGVEMLAILAVALQARMPGLPADAPRWRKLGATLGYATRLVFSRRLWPLLKALVADGLVHRRLARIDRRRWLTHLAVFGSWLALGVISIVTGVIVEVLPLLGQRPEQVAAIPLFGHLFHADVGWVALANEVLGLVTLAGMGLIVYRRYVQRDPQLRTFPGDGLVIALLTFISLSGFPTETFRLLADYTTAGGAFAPDPGLIPAERLPLALHGVWGPQWGFAGYLGARLLGTLRLDAGLWRVLHNVSFWLHFAAVTVLLLTMPFSRFFHAIASPVIVAYNTLREAEAQ